MSKTKAPNLDQRAKAIINSKSYDEDTRASIKHMLETNDAALAKFVRRAEAGEIVADFTTPAYEARTRELLALTPADHLAALLAHPDTPEVLRQNMRDALREFQNTLDLAALYQAPQTIRLSFELYEREQQARPQKGGTR
jgi:hypothetical protein